MNKTIYAEIKKNYLYLYLQTKTMSLFHIVNCGQLHRVSVIISGRYIRLCRYNDSGKVVGTIAVFLRKLR